MNEIFYLTVEHRGQTLSFETMIIQSLYTQKFNVNIEGIEVLFEKDEENTIRAVLKKPEDEKSFGKIKRDLITVIAEVLEKKYQ